MFVLNTTVTSLPVSLFTTDGEHVLDLPNIPVQATDVGLQGIRVPGDTNPIVKQIAVVTELEATLPFVGKVTLTLDDIDPESATTMNLFYSGAYSVYINGEAYNVSACVFVE